MAIYDPKSRVAEEFINDQEIRDTLAYAEEHKSDVPLLMSILDKAAQFKGLTHREAAVLLACDVKEVNDRIFETAIKVKEHIYGSRIVLIAPTSRTTASTPARTARTMPRTRASCARSSRRRRSATR